MFADQTRNARMLQRQGAAVVLHKDDLYNADAIKNAIKTILSDQRYTSLAFKRKHHFSYSENARRISELVKNPPIQPKDLVVKYTEFVAR